MQSPRVASLVAVVVVVVTVNPAAVALLLRSGGMAVMKVMVRQSVVGVRNLVTGCPTLLYCK